MLIVIHASCFRFECVQRARVMEVDGPQHVVRPVQLFAHLNVCLHHVSSAMMPPKIEQSLISRGAAVSYQVSHQAAAASLFVLLQVVLLPLVIRGI